mgnify:CR=1 FL=1
MKKMVLGLSIVAALAVSVSANDVVANDGVLSWLKKSTYSSETVKSVDTINDVVTKIADQLGSKKSAMGDSNIAITSFVDLNHLNKTTNFGRILGESFFNELHKRDFNVMDFRMQKELSVNANGEFFISRDIAKLNPEAESSYVLVGTYSQIEEGVLINARIISIATGKVVASSRVVYNDKSCEIFENCPAPITEKIVEVEKIVYVKPEPTPVKKIKITTDGCAKEVCPTNCKHNVCEK